MKKIFLLLLIAFFLTTWVVCTDTVEKEFYLEGNEKEENRPLPNTLRTELFVGESTELFAESYPEKGVTGFSWELKENNGSVSIFPSGDRCTLLANCEGEETVVICLRGGGSAEVSVMVKPAPKINVRTFEPPEPEKERGALLCVILRVLVAVLILGGAALIVFGTIFYIRRRKR